MQVRRWPQVAQPLTSGSGGLSLATCRTGLQPALLRGMLGLQPEDLAPSLVGAMVGSNALRVALHSPLMSRLPVFMTSGPLHRIILVA
jgi:hypothetical protein